MSPREILEAAKLVIMGNSSDSKRASMSLLRAGSKLAEAEMLRTFETAQNDCIKELARLKSRDLVTYHTEGALARIGKILSGMLGRAQEKANDLISINMIGGKLGQRVKSGDKPMATAFDLAQGDHRRVERLVNQLMGKINHAAACTEQSIRAKVLNAGVNANLPHSVEALPANQANIPSIASIAEIGETVAKKEPSGLSKKAAKEIEADPIKKAKEIVAGAHKQIQFMRTQYVIGRREADIIRKRTLQNLAIAEAKGTRDAAGALISDLMADGLTAFVDRGGRRWTLPNYCHMAVRTTSAQSANVGMLFDDEDHDLFRVVPHQTPCPICAKYEGRVFSRSGTSPYYPPLTDIFGKIDKNGDNSLENTYLTIHPNCRHVLARYIERARTPEQIEEMRRFSNPATNPYSVDPRTEEKVLEYKERERKMAKHNEILREYRRLLPFLGAKKLGNFLQFKAHYIARDKKYHAIMEEFSALGASPAKQSNVPIDQDAVKSGLMEKLEAERKAQREAEAKLEAARKKKERAEAERKEKAEAQRRAKEEAKRIAREQAEREAREKREEEARKEREQREQAERIAREQAEQRAREEAKRLEEERKAREEAEKAAREAKRKSEIERAEEMIKEIDNAKIRVNREYKKFDAMVQKEL